MMGLFSWLFGEKPDKNNDEKFDSVKDTESKEVPKSWKLPPEQQEKIEQKMNEIASQYDKETGDKVDSSTEKIEEDVDGISNRLDGLIEQFENNDSDETEPKEVSKSWELTSEQQEVIDKKIEDIASQYDKETGEKIDSADDDVDDVEEIRDRIDDLANEFGNNDGNEPEPRELVRDRAEAYIEQSNSDKKVEAPDDSELPDNIDFSEDIDAVEFDDYNDMESVEERGLLDDSELPDNIDFSDDTDAMEFDDYNDMESVEEMGLLDDSELPDNIDFSDDIDSPEANADRLSEFASGFDALDLSGPELGESGIR